jgi:GT2 family glycosyltransferase
LVAAALLFVCFRFFFLTPKKEVDIVVVTFNAFIYAKQGLETLKRNTDWQKARLHLVDSGSNTESLSWFEEFCESWFCRFSTRGDVGYTRAANYGVKQGVRKLVVLMNPDVLVCSSWLENLIKAMNTCPTIAAVGPHSNAASFQSIPDIFDEDGNLARNGLPDGLHVEDMCRMVQSKTFHDFPDTTFLNGFLMLFKRSAFDAVGGLDDTNFPIGYGEENDFCIRLQNAGYSLAVADNTYAYHFKTTGFSQEKRVELSRNGSLENRAKHGKVFFV